LNRAVLVATLLFAVPLTQLPPDALAQQPAATPTPAVSPSATPVYSPTPPPNLEDEGPRDLQERIDIFQDRRLIYELNEKDKTYTLRQGPDPIYDADFVELMNDESLNKFWYGERNKDWAIWLGTGAVGLPVGALIFLQNFRAEGPLAFFASASNQQVQNVSDPKTFALSVAGVALAMYGAYNLSLWVTEQLDTYHPNRLDDPAIAPRVRSFNDDLRERLNLEPADIPSPPTPRPSPSPTPSVSPNADVFPLPSTPGRVDQSLPMGGPPRTIPTPLPLNEPGVVPSALVPTTKPRPSEFLFPGRPGREPAPIATTSPRPSAKPKASPKPTPRPSVAYPGTEP
jgi:hypothetical protein